MNSKKYLFRGILVISLFLFYGFYNGLLDVMGAEDSSPPYSEEGLDVEISGLESESWPLSLVSADELIEIYNKSNQAQKAGDIQVLSQYVTGERREELETDVLDVPEEEKEMAIGFIKAMAPLSYELVRQEIDAESDTAILYLEGFMSNFFSGKEELADGEVTFLREGGEWKISKETWTVSQKGDISDFSDLEDLDISLEPIEDILALSPPAQKKPAQVVEPKAAAESAQPKEVGAAKEPVPEEKPISKVSLDFKEADIHNVLRILSYKSGVNIVASPEVAGLITIRLTDVPWDTALDVILATYGYGYERKENIITVYPMAMLTIRKQEEQALAAVQPTITKVIKLKFVDALDMKKALDPQLSPRGRITVLEMTGQAGWEFGGEDLGKRKRLSEKVSRSKMLIISDIPPVLEKLEAVIAKLDIRPQLVLIEVRILEVNRDKLKDFGLEWGTGADGDSYIETSGKDQTESETEIKIKSNAFTVAPSIFSSKSGIRGTFPFDAGLTAIFRKITGTEFQAILHAVSEDIEVNTLSAPRILTLSGQEAAIMIGTKYPILSSEASTEAANTVFTTLDYYQDVGIQLNVVPQVNDDGYINLIVHPAVTSTTQYVGDNEYPIIVTREIETQLLIKDGETVVIGGLLKDVIGEGEIGVPFFSKIPFIGALFKRKVTSIEKVDLLIFITAKTVNPEEDLITLKTTIKGPVRNLMPEADK